MRIFKKCHGSYEKLLSKMDNAKIMTSSLTSFPVPSICQLIESQCKSHVYSPLLSYNIIFHFLDVEALESMNPFLAKISAIF